MDILDLGCGSGWLVEALRSDGYNAIGIDPSLSDSNSRSYLLSRSAYGTGFTDGSFDCIICLETIEHLEPRVFGEIARIGKDGGKLILTTPKRRWNWFIELLSSAGLADSLVTPHINLVSPDEIPFVLEETGSFMFFEWYGVYRIRKM
jgi:2-polyprenyl-3-methyl-5-hydroxy-6-metoxy-1,4-benzoquinol methylase